MAHNGIDIGIMLGAGDAVVDVPDINVTTYACALDSSKSFPPHP